MQYSSFYNLPTQVKLQILANNPYFRAQNIGIVSQGKSGIAVAKFLHGIGYPFKIFDTRDITVASELATLGIELHKASANSLKDRDLLIIGPGLDPKDPIFKQALDLGATIIGDIELFLTLVQSPIIAITGSNGKSTVVTLINYLLQSTGIQSELGGNIGTPVFDLAVNPDIYVLELSSYQLETSFSHEFTVSSILNITEDHLDRYLTIEPYTITKHRIYANSSYIVYNSDDIRTYPSRYKVFLDPSIDYVNFSTSSLTSGYHFDMAKQMLVTPKFGNIEVNDLSLRGVHNYANMLTALASIAPFIDNEEQIEAVCKALKTFVGLPHRFELVHSSKLPQGGKVEWINDSKATNLGATLAALDSCKSFNYSTLNLLVGGDAKGQDLSGIVPALQARGKVVIYAFGKDRQMFDFADQGIETHFFETMEQAIEAMILQLEDRDIVLLSPACASLDQYKNFEVRGDHFTQLARAAFS